MFFFAGFADTCPDEAVVACVAACVLPLTVTYMLVDVLVNCLSDAVTVIVALPGEMPVIYTVLPLHDAVATLVLLEYALADA